MTVVSFRSKPTAYFSPLEMLRDLSKIDATLVCRLEENGEIYIGYEAPGKHFAKFNAILSMLDRCDESWHFNYFAVVLNMLAIEDSLKQPVLGSPMRFPLRMAFIEHIPATGFEAFEAVIALNDLIKEFEDERPSLNWLSAVNRRADLLRLMWRETGTVFGQEVATAARRFAEQQGIDVGGWL